MSRLIHRQNAAALALALTGAALGGCTPATNAGINCAWPVLASRDALNVAYPDAGATYFATRYRLLPGQRIELSGTYPFARYTSFVTYGATGSAIDILSDRDIAPDPGSRNPFTAAGAPTDPAERRFTITIDPSTSPGNPDNRLAPSTTRGGVAVGTIIQRIYVPDDAGDLRGGVPLPTITVRNPDGTAVPTRPCESPAPDRSLSTLISLFGPPTNRPALDPPLMARPPTLGGLYANPDNVYVAGVIAHAPGRVVVVRGTAPTYPDTRAGESPSAPSQLRYWSMCSNEYRKPYPVTDCATDADTVLDDNGNYTFVVSTPRDRPTNATTTNDVTWLDWGSTSVNGLLILRHMLPDPSFTQSTHSVAPGEPAASTMGPYAPVAKYCSTASFEADGAAGCDA